MIEIRSTAGPVYHPRVKDCALLDAELTLELNKAGALSFILPPGHPVFDALQKLKTEVWYLCDGEEIFRGRILETETNMRGHKECVCEGLRNVLNDEVLFPSDLSGGTYHGSAAGMIDAVCAAYNARNPDAIQFARGTVDDFGTISIEAADYPKIGELLDSALVSVYGGYLSVKRLNGKNLVSYTKTSGPRSGQMIRFGENLLDLTQRVTAEDVYSVVIPLGKDLGEGRGRLTIETAQQSGGFRCIERPAAVALFGRITRVLTFDEIEDADALYAAGAEVLNNGGGMLSSLELSAADLVDAGVETDRLQLGAYHRVYSPPHDIDAWVPLLKLRKKLLRADQAEYTFGAQWESLTGRSAKSAAASQTALSAAARAQATASAAATPAQVATAIATSEARYGDYVTEQGSEGIWTWEKRASGISECWGVSTLNVASGGMTAWDTIFCASTTTSYPEDLFIDVPTLHMSPNTSNSKGFWVGMRNPQSHTKTTAAYAVLRASNITSAGVFKTSLWAVGRWKEVNT